MRNKYLAQSIIEYVLFISIIALALAMMQVYGKRGLSAVLKKTADTMTDVSHNESDITYNETEKKWFKAWGDPKIEGANTVQSAEREDVEAGRYSSTKVSRVETKFKGEMVGEMAKEKE